MKNKLKKYKPNEMIALFYDFAYLSVGTLPSAILCLCFKLYIGALVSAFCIAITLAILLWGCFLGRFHKSEVWCDKTHFIVNGQQVCFDRVKSIVFYEGLFVAGRYAGDPKEPDKDATLEFVLDDESVVKVCNPCLRFLLVAKRHCKNVKWTWKEGLPFSYLILFGLGISALVFLCSLPYGK